MGPGVIAGAEVVMVGAGVVVGAEVGAVVVTLASLVNVAASAIAFVLTQEVSAWLQNLLL